MDEDEHITNVFWSDHAMQSDYIVFGDFVSFDTTYRTNDEHRLLKVFVGVNHHKSSVVFVFGVAIIKDDEEVRSVSEVCRGVGSSGRTRVPIHMRRIIRESRARRVRFILGNSCIARVHVVVVAADALLSLLVASPEEHGDDTNQYGTSHTTDHTADDALGCGAETAGTAVVLGLQGGGRDEGCEAGGGFCKNITSDPNDTSSVARTWHPCLR